jgi:hypothetical protein
MNVVLSVLISGKREALHSNPSAIKNQSNKKPKPNQKTENDSWEK